MLNVLEAGGKCSSEDKSQYYLRLHHDPRTMYRAKTEHKHHMYASVRRIVRVSIFHVTY